MDDSEIHFYKYQAAGNDFILVDHRGMDEGWISRSRIEWMCDRHRGIGADGLIFLDSSDKADYRMRIFNADGSEAAMCGNGICCLMLLIQELGDGRAELAIETLAGIVLCRHSNGKIAVNLNVPKILYWPMDCKEGKLFVVDTGVPHAVLFVDQLEKIAVDEIGRSIRSHPQFAPDGVNVNFVTVKAPGDLHVRTYERGVEKETLSCGTGAAAAAYVAAELLDYPSPVHVCNRLSFHFHPSSTGGRAIEMMGSAQRVFSGKVS